MIILWNFGAMYISFCDVQSSFYWNYRRILYIPYWIFSSYLHNANESTHTEHSTNSTRATTFWAKRMRKMIRWINAAAEKDSERKKRSIDLSQKNKEHQVCEHALCLLQANKGNRKRKLYCCSIDCMPTCTAVCLSLLCVGSGILFCSGFLYFHKFNSVSMRSLWNSFCAFRLLSDHSFKAENKLMKHVAFVCTNLTALLSILIILPFFSSFSRLNSFTKFLFIELKAYSSFIIVIWCSSVLHNALHEQFTETEDRIKKQRYCSQSREAQQCCCQRMDLSFWCENNFSVLVAFALALYVFVALWALMLCTITSTVRWTKRTWIYLKLEKKMNWHKILIKLCEILWIYFEILRNVR